MIRRCTLLTDPSYKDYGGRGITVCDRWLERNGFASFLADMGHRPVGMLLDRRDNDGPYRPENCQWVTRYGQNRNKRNTRMLSCGGKTQCSKDWARELKIEYRAFHYFLKAGWTLHKSGMRYLLKEPKRQETQTSQAD
jgi:hypothetical protein